MTSTSMPFHRRVPPRRAATAGRERLSWFGGHHAGCDGGWAPVGRERHGQGRCRDGRRLRRRPSGRVHPSATPSSTDWWWAWSPDWSRPAAVLHLARVTLRRRGTGNAAPRDLADRFYLPSGRPSRRARRAPWHIPVPTGTPTMRRRHRARSLPGDEQVDQSVGNSMPRQQSGTMCQRGHRPSGGERWTSERTRAAPTVVRHPGRPSGRPPRRTSVARSRPMLPGG